MRISASFFVACVKTCRIVLFFFRMREHSEDYCKAAPAVRGLEEGRLVRTVEGGILGHVTVSIPSFRLAFTSDSYLKKHRISPLQNDKEEKMWGVYVED